ncbi:serine/threonine kinase protein [Actinoplanes sp. SE50]|uniref:diguanylate cyclase n=1 Tax=unclassified Actinoplanes TaxID=2626549 RepID=UPI00023ECCAA|nr:MULTISPECIES: diguanylate cyclase [unclassified Actinoplanes]AEV84305.1 serine/threonine kinase protein [Actinoplanes sp. SE50/110]ATO82697.1 serine/threonine kinase protein [Actinoplanes sp. SE50]SLM00104.1 serine/threonine protein kinase [Actinoplanes sp. SE50/110]
MSAAVDAGPQTHRPSVAGLEMLEELGRGTHASVYRVQRDGREYALKMVHADVLDRAGATAAFRREAALLACVDHPSVGRVYDVGETDGTPFLIMELVQGMSLAALRDQRPVSVVEAVAITAELAAALAAAHRVGIVHRDVTPRNIIVLPDGRPKLVDFGLAARQDHSVGHSAAGTFAYAAPEQTGMLARPVDGRADLYALGVVLFECLTGRAPFASTDVAELVRMHAVEPAPAVRDLNPEVPVALAAVVARLLAKDPDDRYADGDDVAAVLRGLVDNSAEERRVEGTGGRLVGRETELAELTRHWAGAGTGRAGAVRLAGVPGAGKTRLAGELARRARAAGHPVLTLLCAPGAPAMAPLRAALERYLDQVDRLPAAAAEEARQRLRTMAGDGAAVLQLLSPALRHILRAPQLADEDRQDQLVTATVAFLNRIGHAAKGLLVHVDDVQWADDATSRVLTALSASSAPVLIVSTERTGEAAWAPEVPIIEVPPMDEAEMAALMAHHLGNAAVPSSLVEQILARSEGNPFAALQYLNAMLDAGVLLPQWGSWRLDQYGLDRLDLPTDVLDLVVARTRALPETNRRLLVAAAAVGAPFTAALLAEVCDTGLPAALEAVQDGVARGILEPAGGGRHAFLHQRLREALLSDVDAAGRRVLHRLIAEHLDAADTGDSRDRYRIARHYTAAGPEADPLRTLAACRAAADAALTNHAAAQALEFLDLAEQAATDAGVPLDGLFHRQRGVASLRAGHLAAAERELAAALEHESDPLRRADLLAKIAHAQHSDFAATEALRTVRAGLRELGQPVPSSVLLQVITGLAYLLVGWSTGRRRHRYSGRDEAARQRDRVVSDLCDAGAMAAAVGMHMMLIPLFHFRALPAVHRLGPGPEYARVQAALAMIADAVRLSRLAERCYARADRAARAVGDPRLTTRVPWSRATGTDAVAGFGPATGSAIREMLREHGTWLPPGEYLSGVGALAGTLLLRGYTREAQAWYDRGRDRLAKDLVLPGNPIAAVGVQVAAMSGNRAEAQARLGGMLAAAGGRGDDQGRRMNIMMARACMAAEFPDTQDIDALTAEVRRWRITPRRVWPQQRNFWLYLAWAELARCRSAEPQERAARLRLARDAVAAFGRAADNDVLRAFHHAVLADYLELTGAAEKALTQLSHADRLGCGMDLPLLAHLVAVGRCRALRALDRRADADRQAELAVAIAVDHGWEHRARAGHALLERSGSHRTTVSRRQPADVTGELLRRRLHAVQELSAAAATVLDPGELARVALDETMRTFAAERAILFLAGDAGGPLTPYLGRGAGGTDLVEVTGYAASLVCQVHHTGSAVVLTGTDDGTAVRSQSVVANGLRSVMIAPLVSRGDVMGAVYLDTRLAQGAFSEDDADLLNVITQQISASLVTARAAQLEVNVRTAERQRAVADMMRAAVSDLAGTLVPDEALARLLTTFVRVTGADAGILIPLTGSAAAVAGAVDATLLPGFAALDAVRRGAADGLWAEIDAVTPGAQAWVAAPLAGRDGRIAVAVLTAREPGRFDDSHVSVVAALAEQGMVAYENAQLFTEVRRLATTDALTGIHNRRHFFEGASERCAQARRTGTPLSALMIDIDHFKRINDDSGHGAGDDVIQAVAGRLRDVLGGQGLLGRYGGEEFACALPGRSLADTAHLAEAMRAAVAGEPVVTRSGPIPVTVSIGLAELGEGTPNLDDVLGSADAALYEAKRGGRNRVAHHMG